ncbi:MAG: universal stress protein [Flavobacteriales bacterium]|jgi:nucleotide-binding universal stress UspA family protein
MRIFHPTDLGSGSDRAFLHALRIAVNTRSAITIMHVADNDGQTDWSEMPGVRSTLAKWGLIGDAHDMEGLQKLGVGVRKVILDGGDPVGACLEYLEEHPTDLVVMAAHGNEGGRQWFRRKVATPLARGAGEPTLFVPYQGKGFLEVATGKVSVRRVLVPVTMDPHPKNAIEMAYRLITALEQQNGVLTLLHVGDEASAPHIELPSLAGWKVEQVVRPGEVVGTIVHMAEAIDADVVVMATKGRDGFLDALRGTQTEQVVRSVSCPVLAVPA